MTLDQLFHHWAQIHQDTLATIGKFGDDELEFRPYPDSWTTCPAPRFFVRNPSP